MDINDFINANMVNDVNISFMSSLYSILASLVSAILIRKAYIIFGRSMNNREYFGNTFILLSITTCVVIIIVKYSLALSLGLVGALSIVRFRAAIKEPEELVFLFLCIGAGLATGANQYLIAIISIVLIVSILFLMKWKRVKYISQRARKESENILNIEASVQNDILNDVNLTMNKYMKSAVVKSSMIEAGVQKFSFVVVFSHHLDYFKFIQEFKNKHPNVKMSIFSRVPIAE